MQEDTKPGELCRYLQQSKNLYLDSMIPQTTERNSYTTIIVSVR